GLPHGERGARPRDRRAASVVQPVDVLGLGAHGRREAAERLRASFVEPELRRLARGRVPCPWHHRLRGAKSRGVRDFGSTLDVDAYTIWPLEAAARKDAGLGRR